MKKVTFQKNSNEHLLLNPITGQLYDENEIELMVNYDYYLGQYGEPIEGWI